MAWCAALLLILSSVTQLDPLTPVGTLDDGLRSPARIALVPGAPDTILVTDPFNDRIARFDPDGVLLGTWTVADGPLGVAVHPDGRYFVSLRDTPGVAVYDAAFTFIEYLGDGNPSVTFVRPTDIAVSTDTERIYVVDSEGHRVYGFNADGSVAVIFGTRGSLIDQFIYPSAIAVDEANTRLIVADHDNFRIQAFAPGGVLEHTFGARMKYPDTGQEGWMPRTQGLAVDASGRIYVADALMGTVRIFDATGEELGSVVGYGYDPGDVRVPCDIALGSDGALLYVVSTNSSSVEVYETPTFLRDIGQEAGSSDAEALSGGAAGRKRTVAPRPGRTNSATEGGDPWLAGVPIDGRSVWDGPHVIDAPVICERCHGITGQPGSHPGTVEGQSVSCMSCHSSGGQALDVPIHERDVADPYGTNPAAADGRGRSHAWGVPAINAAADSVGPDAGGMMYWFLDGSGNIKCSTCHNQHNSEAGYPYLRVSNEDSAMCRECHSPRDEGLGELGTHPVGFHYPEETGEFPAEGPDGLPPGKNDLVECTTCHGVHFADSGGANDGEGDGRLLRGANDETFCQICHSEHIVHTPGGPWQPTCRECHAVHDPDSVNLSLVAVEVNGTPMTFEDDEVVVDVLTDFIHSNHDPASYDGMCEVCHTDTLHHRNTPDGDHSHFVETDCTTCHPHSAGFMPTGGTCDACHGYPPDGTAFPNTAGAHAAHADDVSGPGITDCFTCHALLGGTHMNGLPSFASGVDGNTNDNIELSETDVCNVCHSPDGAYDGLTEARDNWTTGDGVSCEGCHDDGSSIVQGVSAPAVAGDGTTWGYFATGHGRGGMVNCTDCHDTSAPHFDGEPRTFSWNSSQYGPGQSGVEYASAYRLSYVNGEVPLMIPANYYITFESNAQAMKDNAFRLCFQCHDSNSVLDDTPGDGLDTNFKATLPNPPRNYSYAWGSGADVNEHVSHLLNYIGPFADSDWDTSTNGPGGSDGRDTLMACSSCHNVHGAVGVEGSTNEAMVRDGSLAGRTGYGFSYVVEDTGAGGYPWVTSTGATRATSAGAIFRYNTADMCGGSMCHGDPVPPAGPSYDATESSWGSYLEYYRPWEEHGIGCTTCHGVATDNGDGIPVGGRRAVVGEFPVSDAHAHFGSELGDDACVVCHDQTTHGDGYVDLIHPDGGPVYRFLGAWSHTADPADPDLSEFCAGCHDADGPTALADPTDPFGTGSPPADIWTKFQGTLQWYDQNLDTCWGEEGSTLRPVNSHHDVGDSDQAWSGARIECLSCHGAHTAGSTQPLVDPFSLSTPWTGGANAFCLSCHGGGTGPLAPGFPAGVNGPMVDTTDPRWPESFWDGSTWDDILGGACVGGDCSSLRGIDSCDYVIPMWLVYHSWTNSAHGLSSKREWTGYSGAPSYELSCMDCHDPHGSYTPSNTVGNPYMIRDVVDGTAYVDDGRRYGGGFNGPPFETFGTIADVVIDVPGTYNPDWGNATSGLCGACHVDWYQASPMSHDCEGCMRCHAHGGDWGEYDWVDGDDAVVCGGLLRSDSESGSLEDGRELEDWESRSAMPPPEHLWIDGKRLPIEKLKDAELVFPIDEMK